jgi:hypothetical protein
LPLRRRNPRERSRLAASATCIAFAAATTACAHSVDPAGFDLDGGGGGGNSGGSGSGGSGGGIGILHDGSIGAGSGACGDNGLRCAVAGCEGGVPTTVTAKVYDPSGQVPLYDVAVYVPGSAVDPIVTGPTCDNCATPTSGNPIVSTLTDATGTFVLSNVPAGNDIPLVMQIGKWRRTVTLPQVKACQDNQFNDPSTFRLPRNQGEGDLPKIALAVGGADTLECLLRRMGVSDSEFTNPSGTGRINLFVDDIHGTAGVNTPTSAYSSGQAFPPFSQLFAGSDAIADGGFVSGLVDPLSAYDIVMIACQGSQSAGRAVTSAEKQGLKSFVDTGGRAFLSHYNYSWVRGGSVVGSTDVKPSPEGTQIDLQTKYTQTPFPAIAVWEDPTSLDYAPGGDGTYLVDTSFPRGTAMAAWLVNVGASTTQGQIALVNAKNPATSVIAGVAQRWIYQDTMGLPYLSANTPVEQAATPDQQCGRIVHTGIHVSAGASDSHDPFPGGCAAGPLSAQEKALEFMFFDLSSCVTDESKPPPPPAAF